MNFHAGHAEGQERGISRGPPRTRQRPEPGRSERRQHQPYQVRTTRQTPPVVDLLEELPRCTRCALGHHHRHLALGQPAGRQRAEPRHRRGFAAGDAGGRDVSRPSWSVTPEQALPGEGSGTGAGAATWRHGRVVVKDGWTMNALAGRLACKRIVQRQDQLVGKISSIS